MFALVWLDDDFHILIERDENLAPLGRTVTEPKLRIGEDVAETPK